MAKEKKQRPPYNLSTEIRSALRQRWRFHPSLQQALKRERIEEPYVKKDGTVSSRPRVFYRCYVCGHLFKGTEIQLDHIEAIGPAPGSKYAPPNLSWDTFIARMFCGPDNLKPICKTSKDKTYIGCHAEKTRADRLAHRYREKGPEDAEPEDKRWDKPEAS